MPAFWRVSSWKTRSLTKNMSWCVSAPKLVHCYSCFTISYKYVCILITTYLYLKIRAGPRAGIGGAPPLRAFFQIKKKKKNENLHFSLFFTSEIGSGPSRVAPWTPWIDIKIQKKNSKKKCWSIFSYFFIVSL